MNLVCLGELVINLDHMVDAEWLTRHARESGAERRTLQLRFACPQPARIAAGPSDDFGPTAFEWVAGALTVVVPAGDTADRLWALILGRCVPAKPIGDVKGRTVPL